MLRAIKKGAINARQISARDQFHPWIQARSATPGFRGAAGRAHDEIGHPHQAAQLKQVARDTKVGVKILDIGLGACRTWGVESENRPRRGQFLPDLQAHSLAMGQKDGEKWTAAVDLQPTIPKSDRLLGLSSRTGPVTATATASQAS